MIMISARCKWAGPLAILACLHDQNKSGFFGGRFYLANQSNLKSFQKVLIGWKKVGFPKKPLLFWSSKPPFVIFVETKNFSRWKSFFSKQKWRFPPFKIQNIIWTGLTLTWLTVNSVLIMNYDELNRFTGSLTYSIPVRRFICFYAVAQRGRGAWHNGAGTLLVPSLYRRYNNQSPEV